MRDNSLDLSIGNMQDIAITLQKRIAEGLKKDGTEIACLPLYIDLKQIGGLTEGSRILVIDFGGTNLRAAIATLKNRLIIIEDNYIIKRELPSKVKESGYTRDMFFAEILSLVKDLPLEGITQIGYCFSYPTKTSKDGTDEILIKWTKGLMIEDMEGKPVGEPLKAYLNEKLNSKGIHFKTIRVANDTVASLLAGLDGEPKDNSHIGIIVGTGYNIACLIKPEGNKLKSTYSIPVNLESGGLHPMGYLSEADDILSINTEEKKFEEEEETNKKKAEGRKEIYKPRQFEYKNEQRIEKAISGAYLGNLLKTIYPYYGFDKKFDTERLNAIINYPGIYKDEIVATAWKIYERSAKFVATSLAGVILMLIEQDPKLEKIHISAEGSLFWSKAGENNSYKQIVETQLSLLLKKLNQNVQVEIFDEKENAILRGTAIAGLLTKE
ncbi:hexokinase [Paludibacter sp. 221]|uniref:hexokinase n=1 Tax=Paludibacter sp. 221 TaxID=2302939 RepID=UPI0013D23302|nr:hexokinase [Paludibacter sp. 221]NDV47757.1 hexokinase [Paludibacter sp. 221]